MHSVELRDEPVGRSDDAHTQRFADRGLALRTVRRIRQCDTQDAHPRDDLPVSRFAAAQRAEQDVQVGFQRGGCT